MISSIIWLFCLFTEKFEPGHGPWKIYLPIATIELFIYWKFILPKLGDLKDKLFGSEC